MPVSYNPLSVFHVEHHKERIVAERKEGLAWDDFVTRERAEEFGFQYQTNTYAIGEAHRQVTLSRHNWKRVFSDVGMVNVFLDGLELGWADGKTK